jgi:hypothetical protein
MSSRKKARLGEDKCTDGNTDTVCTTKSEPYPSITLDFGRPVDIAQVAVAPNERYPGLSEVRIVVSNETAAFGVRAEGFEVEKDSYFSSHGRYLILQRDQSTGGKGGALSIAEVSVFCPKGPYVPGTPGGPWTDQEVLIVKEKVRYMIDVQNAEILYRDTERFPQIVNEVWGNIWMPDDPNFAYWRNKTFWRSDMMLAPTTRKLIQLAFHDCLKNVDSKGNHFGGCDGCLNWEGMDFMNDVPAGNLGSTRIWAPTYRTQPIKYKTDNNKLSTTAMALELVYTDPTWPPGVRELSSSLQSTGKSRADLWQLAANTGLEIEITKANYACSHKVSYQQMVVALEGKEKCLWKLEQPVPFQYGRADCVRNPSAGTTDLPFEATNKESHSNPFGQGDWVLKDLKRDFGMPARQSIALMAVHGIAPEKHNTQLEVAYRWGGNPFLSNNYYKTLGGRPQYSLQAGIRLGGFNSDSVLVGDEFGRPLTREVQGDFSIASGQWWNTSHPDSGPWFFRPMTTHGKDMNISLAARQTCFTYNYTTDTYERKASESCSEATINQTTGVQTGGPPRTKKRSHSFAFYLPYELGFVKDFTVDTENHPRGCNLPDVFPQKEVDGKKAVKKWTKMAINCTRSTFTLEGEDMTSADIVDQFADDHEVWAHAFIEGWQTIQRNGYGDTLLNGPKSSWLGYSLLPEGSPVEFPLLFTENPDFDISRYLAKDEATNAFWKN